MKIHELTRNPYDDGFYLNVRSTIMGAGRPFKNTNLNVTLDKFWLVFSQLTAVRFLDTIQP
jgi:hypothetical protein